MKMRPLTDAEARVVLDEHMAARNWERHIATYRQFARDVFGPRAAIISLGLGLVYNDEGHEPGVATAAVYDSERIPLSPRPGPWAWPARPVRDNPRLRDAAGRPIPVVALEVTKYDPPLPVPDGLLMNYFLDRLPHRTFGAIFVRAEPAARPVGERGYRRLSVEDLDRFSELEREDYGWQETRQFVQYVYGRAVAYAKIQVTAERGDDGLIYTQQRLSVHDAADAEVQPLETNAGRANWLGAMLPWDLVGSWPSEAYITIREALGEHVEIRMQETEDGRMRYLSPRAIEPGLLDRTVIYRIDRPASQRIPTLYVEDVDYSEASARVSEDWGFPVIPLAASTDWVYDDSPIGDFGAGDEQADSPGAGMESAPAGEVPWSYVDEDDNIPL